MNLHVVDQDIKASVLLVADSAEDLATHLANVRSLDADEASHAAHLIVGAIENLIVAYAAIAHRSIQALVDG